MRSILSQTTEPAGRTLEAASAYDNIANSIQEAQKAATVAKDVSEEVALMTIPNGSNVRINNIYKEI